MFSELSEWLFNSGLSPHGICLLWDPLLIWTYAVSDGFIALAYFSIPVALIIVGRRRDDLVYRPLIWLFVAFILLCGATHWLDIITLWLPVYGLHGAVKVATAVASIFTAISLWWFLPGFLALPSPDQFRQTNAALLASRGQLAQAQKMEAVGQLTGGIAHDFNNLLQVITVSLRMMERHIASGRIDETEPFITAMRQASATASSLINRLLAFSRRQVLQPRAIEPDKLVKSVEEIIRRTLGPDIRLDLHLGNGQWNVVCDPSQLESALLNLAINARDAMPGGGVLRIATADRKLSADQFPGEELASGNYVEIEVTDTGVGMTQEVLTRAFEPLFTTKPAGQGTGLGLSQVYGFVRQSGGAVKLESRPGAGATVRLFLPGRERTGAAEYPAEQADVQRRVLVIAEREVRTNLAGALDDTAYSITEAHDGQEGMKILRSGEVFDLLVTDTAVWGMNARQLVDAIRGAQPNMPILLIFEDADTPDHLQLAPGTQSLHKPFSLDQLVDRVRALLTNTNLSQ